MMKDNYFFDNAATTWPKPESVYRFMDEFSRNHSVNPGRSGYALGVESQMMVEQTRRMLAEFFRFPGSIDRVVFSMNATESINQLLFGLLNPGDHVVATVIDHNAVIRPLNHLQRDHGVAVTRLGVDLEGYLDLDELQDSIRTETRLIIVNHGSNVLGSVQDIAAIGTMARQRDIVFAVDTAQTAGVLPIDMQRDQIDVLVFTGHKGLFGPMGTGGMIVSENIELRPQRVGGTGVNSIAAFQPDEYPYRLEAGTLPVPGIAGLHAAQLWFRELGTAQLGVSSGNHREDCVAALGHIHAQENRHVNRLISALSSVPRVTVPGPTDTSQARVATMSVVVQGMSSTAVGEILDSDYHICVRTGLHCAPLIHQRLNTLGSDGTVRIAPGYFTQDDEVDHLISAFTALAR